MVGSAEAQEFRAAVGELKLEELLRAPSADGGQAFRWPSKTSWRHLWRDPDALARYLNAYVALLGRAKEINSPTARFWAAYPFSISVWSTGPGAKCEAVAVSPLHPIRMAWLAAAEQTLWHSRELQGLAGIVEGWNFPFIGPRENSNGRMVAVPSDSGEGQVFAGWSLLVDASVNGFTPLTSPARIAGLPAPGSSASGLNASAVSAALRTYRRINPHVSTLSIDLAAYADTPRLAEVDEAVLGVIADWTSKGGGGGRGGIRVIDSLHRTGASPRQDLDRVLASQSDVPVTWTRYKHDANTPRQSNLRLLQDAGVGVEVSHGADANDGVLGAVPLRRFEATQPPGPGSASAASRPAIRDGLGWGPFAAALRAVEMADSRPQLGSQLFHAAVIDPHADWTVSGESLISPAAMASMVSGSGSGQQMLWEWRPPFLEADRTAQLERRPFVSVVRIPRAFRDQLIDLLSKAQGVEATEEQAEELIEALGARGVGLSSLVAMGGTHAAGALGFFLAFKLAEGVRLAGVEHLVLPIDAFDSFLRALASTSAEADSLRRADLLIVRVESGRVCLIPVEIKFYGFNAAVPPQHLPSPESSTLNEPLDQLASTTDQLRRLRERLTDLPVGEGPGLARDLWLHGLTSLLESGMRLRPHRVENQDLDEGEVLAATLRGDVVIDIGRPLICFFGHGATAAGGKPFEAFRAASSTKHASLGEFGGLLANTAAAFGSVEDPDSEIVRQWSDIIALGRHTCFAQTGCPRG